MSQLLLSVMGAFAEFERTLLKERQREGIELAKRRGVYKGRQKCLTKEQITSLSEALKVGVTKARIARNFVVSRQPGNPQQNAFVKRFNRTVLYDWLNQDIFYDIEEVQEKATAWLWHYNTERPNMALGGITPMQISSPKNGRITLGLWCSLTRCRNSQTA